MCLLDILQKLGSIRVLSKCREDEHKVSHCVLVPLVVWLDLSQKVLTFLMLAKFHQAIRLDRIVEWML